jgi:hypothetical protein
MDIIVHEHIVIGNGTYYSYADNGLIRQMRAEAPLAP